MKFNEQTKQYYLIDDDFANTSLGQTDLSDEYGDKFREHLIEASSFIYDHLANSGYGGYNKRLNAIAYSIHKSTAKQEGLKRALIQHVRSALTSGMDINALTDEGKPYISEATKMALNSGDLYIKGQVLFDIEEVDWND